MQADHSIMHYSCSKQVRVAAKTQVPATKRFRQPVVYVDTMIIRATRVVFGVVGYSLGRKTGGDAAHCASINPLLRREMLSY